MVLSPNNDSNRLKAKSQLGHNIGGDQLIN